jgi:ligand-binding sensor domain-containing protein/serine phosphatase RsbU (regulator of sigma subunit)
MIGWINIRRHIFLLAILLFLSSILSGQFPNYRIKLFDVKDGLTETVINCIMQDSRGYIWIGTNDGLNRYDGHSFYIFRNKLSDSTTICDNLIRSITEDKSGNIWIATSNGLSKFDRADGCFYNFYHSSSIPASLSDNSVYCVFIDSEGWLWVKTTDMLELFDPVKNTFKHFKPFGNVFNRLSPLNHNVIYEDVFQNIWLGTKDGLHLFDRKRERFQLFTHDEMDPMSISNNAVRTIFEDHKGNLWIGTDNGINQYLRRAKSFRHFIKPLTKFGQKYNNVINTMCQDMLNYLWVGTTDGLFRLNPVNEECTSFEELFPEITIGNISRVNSIMIDHTNIIWIGTTQGLIKIDTRSTKFHTFHKQTKYDEESSINNISSIYVDEKQNVWTGTWGKGIQIYNHANVLEKEITSSNKTASLSLACDNITTLHYSSPYGLWIGTSNGLYLYDLKKQLLKNYVSLYSDYSIDYFENNRIYCIHEVSKNALWIGAENGLYYLDPNTSTVRSFFLLKNDSLDVKLNSIYTIIEDDDNYLYIGSDRGMIKFNPSNNDIIHYTNRGKASRKISSNVVFSILIDSKKTLWVGTNTGLNKYLPHENRFALYTEDEGMPNNQVFAMEEDSRGNIWISTNRGLACMNPQTNQILSFDLTDGLQDYKFNIGSSFKSNDGELFFGGINGYNSFYADSIRYNPFIPNIVINSIEYNTQGKTAIIHVDTGTTVTLSYRTRFFNIDFSALDFTFPEKNNYAYYLVPKGHKGDWTFLGKKHTASFYNLPSGEYTLRVKGSNNDNTWNERGTTINIIIETPFWKTKIALFFYAVLIILTLYFAYMYRTRTLRQTNKILREKEQASIIVSKQKEELSIKNKNITDSIYYAKRIQDALMPSDKLIQRLLPNSFIYIRPRDIVSGDFYWIAEKEDKIYLAAVDCTGHGVPGAIMSILGFELFRTTFSAFDDDNAAKFLDKLNYEFTRFLSDEQNYNLRDGMDVSLCIFDFKNKTAQFAGAINPLYIIRDNKIIDVKSDRFSVSLSRDQDIVNKYKNNIVELKQGDMLYMFSDGYADQFGGPEGKKYKYRRFRHLLLNIHKLPTDEQRQFLDESMDNWKGELEQVDDILIIGIKIDYA